MASSSRPAEFLPLDAESVEKKRRSRKSKTRSIGTLGPDLKRKSNVVYVGRIPHGFYEDEMRGFFSQFGNIKRLRISRNKKTGKSKHYAFIQFESPEVAEIVAEAMHNYLLFEHLLQVRVVPLEKLHENMWAGCNRVYKPPNGKLLERMHHNRERDPKEQQRMLKSLLKRERKRRRKIKSAGIEYDYPDLGAFVPAVPKKIKFSDTIDNQEE